MKSVKHNVRTLQYENIQLKIYRRNTYQDFQKVSSQILTPLLRLNRELLLVKEDVGIS